MKIAATAYSAYSACLAGFAVAAPSAPKAFDVMALRSASDIHFASLSAAHGSLLLNLRDQNARCDGENNRAILYIKDSQLFLYSKGDSSQQIFVDRSGMGQGVIGYINRGTPPPRNAELRGWSINEEGNLVFHDQILQACPGSFDGSWSVWTIDVIDPAGNQGCLGFSPRTLPNDQPVSCVYSSG